jgi:hypothetical protein
MTTGLKYLVAALLVFMAVVVLGGVMKWEWYLWHDFVPAWWGSSGKCPEVTAEYRTPAYEAQVQLANAWQNANWNWHEYSRNFLTETLTVMFGVAHVVALLWFGPIALCAAWKTWVRPRKRST